MILVKCILTVTYVAYMFYSYKITWSDPEVNALKWKYPGDRWMLFRVWVDRATDIMLGIFVLVFNIYK